MIRSLTARLRLLPWKEELATKSAASANDEGEAAWEADDDANAVTLAHLAAHDDQAPRLRVAIRGRELLVYERTLGEGIVDAAPFLKEGDPKEAWVALEPAGEVLLELQFQKGITTPASLSRTESAPVFDGPAQPQHQHLFRLASVRPRLVVSRLRRGCDADIAARCGFGPKRGTLALIALEKSLL